MGKIQLRVYETLMHFGPLTTRQIALRSGIEPHVVSPRVTEFSEMGIVDSVGVVKCELTGMEVNSWQLRDQIPEKRRKKAERWCGWLQLDAAGRMVRVIALAKKPDITLDEGDRLIFIRESKAPKNV